MSTEMVIWLVDCFYINGCLYIFRCLYILYIFQAGTGFTPARIIDLARPQTPKFLAAAGIACKES